MDRHEIMDTLEMLASSQGFYGRILDTLDCMDSSDLENFFAFLESKNFADPLDLVMFFEC